jgi:hypothetical protein
MFPDALIDRVDAPVPGIAYPQTPPAGATEQHTLQQAETFTRWARQHLTVCAVSGEAKPVGFEPAPVDVALVMIAYHHPPCVLRNRTQAGGDLAGWANLFGRLIAAEHIGAGV